MSNIVKFAAKNVTANKKRTMITLAVIIIGIGSINIGKGIMAGMQKESELSVTQGRTGEIQIHRQGYFDASELNLLSYAISNADGLLDEIHQIDSVESASGRIQFGGLLAKGDETAVVVFCKAVDTVNELKVCPRIIDNICEGRFLTEDDENGAVISDGLRRGTGAKIGDSIILVANTKDGYQNAVELEIVGIVKEKAAQANTRLVYISQEKAQELLYMENEVTEIVLKTDDGNHIKAVSEKIGQLLKSRNLKTNTWMDVSSFFVDVMEKQNLVVFALCIIFYCIVVSSIANTMFLSLFERKKEIGTMMAIGIRSGHVIRLIIVESAILGFMGSILGALISMVIIWILHNTGMSYKPPAGEYLVTIYPLINFGFILVSFILGILSAILGSIYPARKVLKVNPIEALRTV
jgi:putative ABC transport system permease protein